MKRASAWLVPVGLAVLVMASGVASAEYGVGSRLTADDPIQINGRGDAELLSGIAAFLGASPSGTAVSVTAQEAWFDYRQISTATCASFDLSCDTRTGSPATQSFHARDVTVTVTPLGGAFKVVVTNDAHYLDHVQGGRGALVAQLGGTSQVTATDAAQFLSPYSTGWTGQSQRADPLYQVDASTAGVKTGGSQNLEASGDFEALVQGFSVRLQYTSDGGQRTDRTLDTRTTSTTTSFLVGEFREGELTANSAQPLEAYGVDTVKVYDGGSGLFAGASGRVVADGEPTKYDAQAVKLHAPLALKDITVEPGSPQRLSVAISSDLASTDDNQLQQMAAAAAAGAGGAGLLAAAAYFWPRLKYGLTLLALPLYTRIERSQVLDHSKRDEIYELIRGAPGIHAHEIGERTQIGWGTTVYHLKMLESHSLVVSKKSGRYKRFYVNTGEYTKKKDVYGALRNETAKSVAEYVFNHPGTSQKDMCAALGIQPSLASWHVEKLEAVGLVKRVKDGRQVRYFAGPAWADLGRTVPAAATEGGDAGAAQA